MPEATRAQPPAAGPARPPARAQAAVSGVGIAVPETVVDNEPIAARLGVSEDWIVARTGVHERRVAGAETSASSTRRRGGAPGTGRGGIRRRARSTWSWWRR